ncbi:hypothetical protein SAMN05443668_107348 [Cryptosporangium aurantiacum]|uniref:Uncharacterized protein n=1 Tax=Cryptosporangium aurantiacum TaxID=134849 RepID=A0A1M7TYD3_9ACTN|nr:hypothetical protein SAMN05443668_107348 [Cryptosporangium aurantiacum]
MRRRPGRGAAIGLAVGAALVSLLILLPSALQGSFYEIADPLVYMGIPLLVMGAAIGAAVGASAPRARGARVRRERRPGRAGQPPSGTARPGAAREHDPKR